MNGSSSYNHRWEWLSSNLNTASNLQEFEWTIYDDEIQTILNDALEKKLKSVEFDINGFKFEVLFNPSMVQRNLKTGYERQIRLCIKDENTNEENQDDLKDKNICWYFWQWLNETNKWIFYTADITIELENKFKKYKKNDIKSVFKFNLNSNSYSIDFDKMTQVNETSKFARNVKRVASDVTNIKTEQTEASLNEGPSSNLRKRKNLSYNDKQLSTSSTISLNSSEENDGKTLKSGSKKLKRIRDQIKEETGEENENIPINDEESEEEKEEEEKVKPKTSKSGRASKSTKRKPRHNDSDDYDPDVENEDEDVCEKEPEIKKSKSGISKPKKAKIKKEEPDENGEISEIPLDEKFTEKIGFDYMIYREGDLIYDCMLNQLIEKLKTKEYIVWMRWGRVGKAGQFSCENFGSNLNRAKDVFEKKFYDKTNNEWDQKDMFEKCGGKYDLVEKDYGSAENSNQAKSVVKQEDTPKNVPSSKLNKKVQNIIDLICNLAEMENLLKEMKYDAKKSPLGKLSKSQIKAGYLALKEIEELLKNKAGNRQLVEACNDFYTRIPHDFGMKVPPVINTLPLLREKLKLLEILDDIEVAVKVLNQVSEIENPVDRHYDQLNCALKPLDHADKMFKLIESYLHKTHAPTHSNYKLKLVDVFEAEKPGEKEKFKDYGNRMLLWHGSRLTNWAGILSQGLRIAPPEAPVTGYMFGKGCYFADCSSKSANYCYATSNKNTALLSLSEVSLGMCNELQQADGNADKLPKGKMSTKGLGRSEPDKNEWVTLDDGCVIPCGNLKNVQDKNAANANSLLYNEYIVYNVDQIKLRYLVKVEFDFED